MKTRLLKNHYKNFLNFIKGILNYYSSSKSFLLNLIFKVPFLEKPLPEVPFCKKPLASKNIYIKLHQEILNENSESIDLVEKKLGFSIDKDWFHEVSLYTQTCIKKSKLNFSHGRILYSLLSNYIFINKDKDNNSLFILETGTARGFSSLCMSKALNEQKKSGIIITIDCIPHNKRIYWNSISDLNGPMTRAELLKKWYLETNNILFLQGWSDQILKRMQSSRINFAFLDAQHTKKAVIDEFNFVSDKQLKGDIIVFDDVTPGYFDGVCQAVKEIEALNTYEIKYLNFDNLRGYAIATKN